MSRSSIPAKVKYQLWAASGGRCEYDGCNKPLWGDPLTKAPYSTAYIAHIIAEKPEGPRGDPTLSHQLAHEFSNLMLLCDSCHRRIDDHDVDGHPVPVLRDMKHRHESRVALQTSLGPDKASHILLYGANIGDLAASLSFAKACEAMLGHRYPAENRAIDLRIQRSTFRDWEEQYWLFEHEQLKRKYQLEVQRQIDSGDIQHLSVFAIAPQPLLIELGRLLSDAMPIDVYQHQKEPIDSWVWSSDEEVPDVHFEVATPANAGRQVALNLSLSATITNDRINAVLGDDVAIWTITVAAPSRDLFKARKHLQAFRGTLFSVFDRIKTIHGQNQTLHVFPACGTAAAVEIGRVWYPKADLPLRIYDQSNRRGGFMFALEVS